jgi:hypothetical protein
MYFLKGTFVPMYGRKRISYPKPQAELWPLLALHPTWMHLPRNQLLEQWIRTGPWLAPMYRRRP